MRRLFAADARCAEPLRRRALTRRLICDADLPAELADELWRGDADRLVYAGVPLQVKDRSIVARLDRPAGSLLIKRHTWGRWSRTLRIAWRVPTARRCWQLGRLLSEQGIATPRPRACVEYCLGPLGYRSYLLTDYVAGTSLYRLLRTGSLTVDVAERLAEQVAGIWQRLADIGICHNDFKPENFIVDEAHRVWLIDLERVRRDRDADRRLRRQIDDVRTFLHVRSWRRSADVRKVFERAFLNTAAGVWLRTSESDFGFRISDCGLKPNNPQSARSLAAAAGNPQSPGLSVLVMCNDRSGDCASAQRAVESVQDIADEIVLVVATGSGSGIDVRRRIDGESIPDSGLTSASSPRPELGPQAVEPRIADCLSSIRNPQSTIRNSPTSASAAVNHPWVLVLRADECVTPDLARELQERIAEEGTRVAYRVPIERHYFGRRVMAGGASDGSPIRLFHRERCSCAIVGGELSVPAAPEQTGELSKRIQHCECASVTEFIARLNEQTSRAAIARRQRGERSRLMPAMLRACGQFFKSYVMRGGIRDGWVGLQITFIRALFTWLEEAKLRQLSAEFQPQGQLVGEVVDARPILSAADEADRLAAAARSKAA